jgi:hypothetical protein
MTVNEALERMWNEMVMVNLKCSSGICMEGLRKRTKILMQDSECLDQDSMHLLGRS